MVWKTFIIYGSGFQDYNLLVIFCKEAMCNDAKN